MHLAMGSSLKYETFFLLLLVGLPSQISYSQGTEEAPDEILTDQGEIAIDYPTGRQLPEEMDDGELEGGDHHTSWNYTDQDNWAQEYPICQGPKMRQSPIDIICDDVQIQPTMRLEFINYNQEVEFQLKNSHHSVSLTPIPTLAVPTVVPNWLSERIEFELNEVHFHWGDGVNKGSEHEINRQRAAAEMHMVHYKKGIDKTQLGYVDNSVLVIGVLIESNHPDHMDLDNLVQEAKYVNGTDEEYTTIGDPKNLLSLLPPHYQSFYSYNGSLTTPPCYEVVTWVLMSEPVYISNDRLIELSNLEATLPGKGRVKIAANRRNVQPLLDRPVFASNNLVEVSPTPLHISKDPLFEDAFQEFWTKIKGIRGSVRKAYKSVDNARGKLAIRFRVKKVKEVPAGSNSVE